VLQVGAGAHEHSFDDPLGLLSDCHRRIERFLDVLIRVARDFQGKELPPQAKDAVATARRYFGYAAPKHTADEEVSLFPRMKSAAAARGEKCEAIQRLESDHHDADLLHARVDELLHQWLQGPALPPPLSAALSEALAQLQSLYQEHIRVEDAEVFPLAAKTLSAEQLADVGREMRARRGVPAPLN
jgi:hemerythrin-like domain-containing protein